MALVGTVITLVGALIAVERSGSGFCDVSDATVADYRAITLGSDGAVVAVIPMCAIDEDDARRQAALLVGEYAFDLWDGLRFVDHFSAQTRPSAHSLPNVVAVLPV